MKEEEIIEGNKLIAEFMGEKWIDKPKYLNPTYHNNWEFLMPVVEKIESTTHDNGHYYVKIGTDWVFISKFMDYSGMIVKELITLDQNKIQSTWLAVIGFITWHNSQTLKQESNR